MTYYLCFHFFLLLSVLSRSSVALVGLRTAHWEIKTPLLEETLAFFEDSFGLKVCEHEEHDSGGQDGGAWSRTSLGNQERAGLEAVYCYGISHHARGNDLRFVAMRRDAYRGPEEDVITDAEGREFVEAPNLWLRLVRGPSTRTVLFVSLHVSDLKASLLFFQQTLGATLRSAWTAEDAAEAETRAWLEWDGHGLGLELVQLPSGEAPLRCGGGGRLAIEAEGGAEMPEGRTAVVDPDGREFVLEVKRTRLSRDKTMGVPTVNWALRLARQQQARLPPPVTFRPPVVAVSPDTYLSLVTGSPGGVLLEMFAPWCPACVARKPVLEAAAQALPSVTTAALDGADRSFGFLPALQQDASLQTMLAWTRRVGFPTLFYVPFGGQPASFEGAWTRRSLLEWVQHQRAEAGEVPIPLPLGWAEEEEAEGQEGGDDDDCDACSL